MLNIGLTGGIGSGKTIVSKIFEIVGVPVFDADSAAKKIMNENVSLKKQLIAEFGERVYANNELNKKYLSSIVFNDAYKLDKLNALVHPVAIEAGINWANTHKNIPYIIKEAALLFESGSAANLNFVIGVYAPESLRIKRVMKRDNFSFEEATARLRNQIDDNIKMKLCDFTIINDDNHLLISQILNLHKKILQLAQ